MAFGYLPKTLIQDWYFSKHFSQHKSTLTHSHTGETAIRSNLGFSMLPRDTSTWSGELNHRPYPAFVMINEDSLCFGLLINEMSETLNHFLLVPFYVSEGKHSFTSRHVRDNFSYYFCYRWKLLGYVNTAIQPILTSSTEVNVLIPHSKNNLSEGKILHYKCSCSMWV